jgi:hypothetical protein
VRDDNASKNPIITGYHYSDEIITKRPNNLKQSAMCHWRALTSNVAKDGF